MISTQGTEYMGVVTHLTLKLSYNINTYIISSHYYGIYPIFMTNESHPTSRCQTTPSIWSLEGD